VAGGSQRQRTRYAALEEFGGLIANENDQQHETSSPKSSDILRTSSLVRWVRLLVCVCQVGPRLIWCVGTPDSIRSDYFAQSRFVECLFCRVSNHQRYFVQAPSQQYWQPSSAEKAVAATKTALGTGNNAAEEGGVGHLPRPIKTTRPEPFSSGRVQRSGSPPPELPNTAF